MNELTIPTAWLDPRLRQVRDVLATVIRGGRQAGLAIEVRLSLSAAFSEIEWRSELPYPPAGEADLDITDAADVNAALIGARDLLLGLIGDVAPEQGYGFAYAARELAEALQV